MFHLKVTATNEINVFIKHAVFNLNNYQILKYNSQVYKTCKGNRAGLLSSYIKTQSKNTHVDIMNFIIPTTFLTHCVRVSIQI
jgi:hypothetical protein